MNNQNSWMTYIIYFFIASSVFGVLSTFITLFFGFPYTWTALFSMAPLVGGFYLLYRGYSWKAWALAACVGFILLSALAIGRGLLATEPDVPEQLRGYLEADKSGSRFGFDEYYLDYSGDNVVSVGEDKALLTTSYYDASPRTYLTIEYPSLRSDGGQWAFVEGSIQVRGGMNGRFEANPDENWMNADEAEFDEDLPLLVADPYLVVTVPVSAAQGDRQIMITADLTVIYPANGEIKTETLTRQIDALVASDRYYLYAQRFNEWQRARRVIDTPLWIALLIGSMAAGVAAVYLYQQGALKAMATGSLIFEVQRQSGFHRLGVEAHNLSKVDVELDQPIDKGVILGVVRAQSPAGRGGLRSGDVILNLDDKTVNSTGDLNRIARKVKKGERVPAQVIRNGETLDLEIRF